MAKNEKSNPKNWSDITYLRCELDKQLKADLANWLKQKHDWWAYVVTAVGEGLRFSVLDDPYHNCVEARLTALSNSTGINTLVLQGRGPDAMAAVQALFFKHFVVLEQNWENLDRDADKREITDWG